MTVEVHYDALDQIAQIAGEVAGGFGKVTEAEGVASQLTGPALGLLFSWAAPLIMMPATVISTATGAAQGAVSAAAAGVTAARSAYEEADDKVGSSMDGLGGRIGGGFGEGTTGVPL